jgi:hypothetical protein
MCLVIFARLRNTMKHDKKTRNRALKAYKLALEFKRQPQEEKIKPSYTWYYNGEPK